MSKASSLWWRSIHPNQIRSLTLLLRSPFFRMSPFMGGGGGGGGGANGGAALPLLEVTGGATPLTGDDLWLPLPPPPLLKGGGLLSGAGGGGGEGGRYSGGTFTPRLFPLVDEVGMTELMIPELVVVAGTGGGGGRSLASCPKEKERKGQGDARGFPSY